MIKQFVLFGVFILAISAFIGLNPDSVASISNYIQERIAPKLVIDAKTDTTKQSGPSKEERAKSEASSQTPKTSAQTTESTPQATKSEAQSSQKSTPKEESIRMPSLFIAHGAPSIVIEQGEYVNLLKQVHKTMSRPKAILVFSAHWESVFQQISSVQQHSLIYDFSGFPAEMYKMKYPAKGDPELAKEIQSRFFQNDLTAILDDKRGLDHGVWTILKLMYPQADIPVIALSVNPRSSPQELYKIGQSVAALRERGILVIGSGVTVHNLGRLNWGAPTGSGDKWAIDFDTWIEEKIHKGKIEDLFEYKQKAPFARDAVPTPEHFLPLFVALGAGSPIQKAEVIHRSYQYGSLSYMSWRFN